MGVGSYSHFCNARNLLMINCVGDLHTLSLYRVYMYVQITVAKVNFIIASFYANVCMIPMMFHTQQDFQVIVHYDIEKCVISMKYSSCNWSVRSII